MIEEEKAEAVKQSMIAASFTAWQTGAGEKMSFARYLKKLGLSETEPDISQEQKDILTARGLDVADKIKNAFAAGRLEQ